MLQIIQVGRIAIVNKFEVGRIQKLNTQINKSTNCNEIKLHKLEPPVKTRHWIPNPNSECFRVRNISNHRAPYMPHPNQQKQCSRQNMTLERSHYSFLFFAFFFLGCKLLPLCDAIS